MILLVLLLLGIVVTVVLGVRHWLIREGFFWPHKGGGRFRP